MGLRYFQDELIESVVDNFLRLNLQRLLCILPTGGGKTVCFANFPERLGLQNRMLVEVHRDELAEQAASKIRHWNPHLKVGVEMGDLEADSNCDVIVGGVQTLYASGFKRLKHLYSYAKGIDIIVPDEAHHYVDNVFGQTLTMTMEQYPKSLLCGFTATAKRGDKKALASMFDKVAYNFPLDRAIIEGWLATPYGRIIRTATDLSAVRTRAGDFAQNELSEAVNTPLTNGQVVDGWLKWGEQEQTVAFCVDIEHSQELAKEFQKAGVAAEAVWGNDPDRKEKLAMHKKRQLKLLTNCNVLTEGYDDWQIGCIITAAPTKSQLKYVQQVGRGLRIPEGIENLVTARQAGLHIAKSGCIFLDAVGVSGKHSLVTLPSLMGIRPRPT
jgi:ATP-dependent helicase IRC3